MTLGFIIYGTDGVKDCQTFSVLVCGFMFCLLTPSQTAELGVRA